MKEKELSIQRDRFRTSKYLNLVSMEEG